MQDSDNCFLSNSQVSGVVSTKAQNFVCCSPTCLRNFGDSLHANYSSPNLKLRCFSPCPTMETKAGQEGSKNFNLALNPSQIYPDLPRSLADEELWKYFEVNLMDKCKCEAFACRHMDHVKEDLILLAEQGQNEKSGCGKNPGAKNESDCENNLYDTEEQIMPVDCRLIDPVALTLDGNQYFVPILSGSLATH